MKVQDSITVSNYLYVVIFTKLLKTSQIPFIKYEQKSGITKFEISDCLTVFIGGAEYIDNEMLKLLISNKEYLFFPLEKPPRYFYEDAVQFLCSCYSNVSDIASYELCIK